MFVFCSGRGAEAEFEFLLAVSTFLTRVVPIIIPVLENATENTGIGISDYATLCKDLVSDQYPVSAATQVWVSELVSGKKKQYQDISIFNHFFSQDHVAMLYGVLKLFLPLCIDLNELSLGS